MPSTIHLDGSSIAVVIAAAHHMCSGSNAQHFEQASRNCPGPVTAAMARRLARCTPVLATFFTEKLNGL